MSEKKPWFRPKRIGVGWTPQTWQGWLVIAAVIAVAVLLRFVLR